MLVREVAASAAAARMIVRIKNLLGKRIIHQPYCHGLASGVIANTPAQAIRGCENRGWLAPKKNEQGQGPAPETYMDEAKFLFSSETAAALRRLILPRLGPRGRRRWRLLSASTSRDSTLAVLV